jgi:hypothetical protein
MKDHNTDESPIQAVLAAPPDRPTEPLVAGTAPEAELESRLQSRLAVLFIIFVAAGAFGIPLLWVNKRFSQGERVFWSIVAVLYSIGVLVLGAVILMWIWNQTIGSL